MNWAKRKREHFAQIFSWRLQSELLKSIRRHRDIEAGTVNIWKVVDEVTNWAKDYLKQTPSERETTPEVEVKGLLGEALNR